MKDTKVHPSLGPEDSLGGHKKQYREVPDTAVFRTDADVVKHVRERERVNAATSSDVSGIPELRPHSDKRDLPPSAPGKTTRVSKDSDGAISQPNSNARPQLGKNSADPCDSRGNPQRHRQNQTEFDAKERPVEKLRETRKRQLGSNGLQGN